MLPSCLESCRIVDVQSKADNLLHLAVRHVWAGTDSRVAQLRSAGHELLLLLLLLPGLLLRRAARAVTGDTDTRSCVRYSAVLTQRCTGRAPAEGVSPTDKILDY